MKIMPSDVSASKLMALYLSVYTLVEGIIPTELFSRQLGLAAATSLSR